MIIDNHGIGKKYFQRINLVNDDSYFCWELWSGNILLAITNEILAEFIDELIRKKFN